MLEMNVKDVSLNFMGMRQRVKNLWQLDKKFDSTLNIFVDSGCQTLNNAKEGKYSNDDVRALGNQYYQWVSSNIDRIEYFSEFDSYQLGAGYIESNRDSWRDQLFDKVLPIWHGDTGLDSLHELGERFGRVGVLQTDLNGRDLVPLLNRMANSGIGLHGLSMTKPDIMQTVKWESVSSTSWITPQKYGDTIVWSHKQLKRYPSSMRDQALKKERSVILAAGFDHDKLQNKDPKELLRLSLWSWSQLVNSINAKNTRGVTVPMQTSDEEFTENDYDDVGGVVERVPNRAPTTIPRDPSRKLVIPVLDFDYSTDKIKNKVTGELEDVLVPKVKIRSESMRVCDTCFLAPKCPMFEENSTCAYDIPIQIETREQVEALMNSLVSMQTQRVFFMKIAEDMEGQGADPILSGEIDRLGKLIEKKHNLEQEGYSLTITAKQQGKANSLDALFGDMTKYSFGELPAAVPVEDAAKQLGFDENVIDAIVWEDRSE
jgi:hypothetical protein